MAVTEAEARAALEGLGLRAAALEPWAGGHINASWRASIAPGESYLLQRLNPAVFPDGEAVMRNVALVAGYLADRLAHLPAARRLSLRLVARSDGGFGWRAPDGAWWRAFGFIDRTRSCQGAVNVQEAHEVGRAFGNFQSLLRGYSGPPLAITIPAFHDTAARLGALDRVVSDDPVGRASELRADLEFVLRRRGYAEVLPPLLADGSLPVRIVHNDAKAANVLLDITTGEALAVVDLDTVMPGTLLHDVGDLIRSTASPTDEDEPDLSRIGVRPPLVTALMTGFLGACGAGLSDTERRHLVFAGLLITYEQGVRFLSDHIAGDSYYRIGRPGQNLDRARAQFRLLESLEAERAGLEAMVDRMLRVTHG